MSDKKWFDEWEVTKSGGVFTVELPHSHAQEHSITIKGKYTRKHVEWLIDHLDAALSELTKNHEQR
jgi:hypothetical protein